MDLDIKTAEGKPVDQVRHFCQLCRQKTYHGIFDKSFSHDEYDEQIQRHILYCLGCGKESIKRFKLDEYGKEIDVEFNPIYRKWHLTIKNDLLENLPNSKLKKLYNEIIESYNQDDSLIGCGIAVKTLLINVGLDLNLIETNDLQDHNYDSHAIIYLLNLLTERGILTEKCRDVLLSFKILNRDLIHSSIHESPRDELLFAIRSIEHIIESQYLLEPLIESLLRPIK